MNIVTDTLTVGQGRCVCSAFLSLFPAQDVMEMGGGPQVLEAAAHAVHHVNRRGDAGDRIAIGFSGFDMGARGFNRLGRGIVAFGSNEALKRLQEDPEIVRLTSRGLLSPARVTPVDTDATEGVAFRRCQRMGKANAGGIARAERRRVKRGGIALERQPDAQAVREVMKNTLSLKIGKQRLDIRPVQARFTGEVIVSTYGFASSECEGSLPLPGKM